MGNANSLSDSQALNWDEAASKDKVPENAWLVTVWLKEVRGLVAGMSGDIGGLADPYVNFRLSKCKNGEFGPQPQTSSYRKYNLNPRWLPPERFMFVIEESIAKQGSWPKLLFEVMDYDATSKDDNMGNASLDLGKLHSTQPDNQLEYLSDGEDISVPLHHPDTNDIIKGGEIVIRVAAGRKADVLEFKDDRIVEYMRWTPAKGWAPCTGAADPRRFAIASGHAGLYEVAPVKAMFNVAKTATMGAGAAFGLTKSNHAQESAPPTDQSGNVIAVEDNHVFSDPDFDTVASLLERSNQLAGRDAPPPPPDGAAASSGSVVTAQGPAPEKAVAVTHQWSVMNVYGEMDGWQYATFFSRKHADWHPNPTSLSFCRRRYWERRTKLVGKSNPSPNEQAADQNAPKATMATPLRVGWLYKRGEINKSLKERYFVLWPRALVYYRTEPPNYNILEHAPTGAIALRGAEVSRNNNGFDLLVRSTGRSFSITAGNKKGAHEDISLWATAVELTIIGMFDKVGLLQQSSPIDKRMMTEKIDDENTLFQELDRMSVVALEEEGEEEDVVGKDPTASK